MEPIALNDLDWDNKRLSEGCFGGEVYKSKLVIAYIIIFIDILI